jgi:two-component sensor histidine kinase
MFAILHALGMFVADLFKSRCRLEAENLFLRHQLSIALRRDGCQFSGRETRLPASMVLTLTMVLHELATNAAKHGAFRSKEGKLKVDWQQEVGLAGESKLQLSWAEFGVPNCQPQSCNGYGTTLIDTAVSALGGSVDRTFGEDGISVRLLIPLG